jgi:hypothetical protein
MLVIEIIRVCMPFTVILILAMIASKYWQVGGKCSVAIHENFSTAK